jgi:hypothetical protein
MAAISLDYLRQVRTLRAANIIEVLGLLAGTIRRDLVRPVEQLGVDAVALDRTVEPIPAATSALVVLDGKDVELADDVAEYDRAVWASHYLSSEFCWAPPPRRRRISLLATTHASTMPVVATPALMMITLSHSPRFMIVSFRFRLRDRSVSGHHCPRLRRRYRVV